MRTSLYPEEIPTTSHNRDLYTAIKYVARYISTLLHKPGISYNLDLELEAQDPQATHMPSAPFPYTAIGAFSLF